MRSKEISAIEAGLILGVRTAQVVADIQRGRLKGRYDADRSLNAGRWFVDRAEVERAAASGTSAPTRLGGSVRVRIPELLNAKIPTAYAIAKASRNRISLSAAHRLVAKRGAIQRYDASLIGALCEMFSIGPGDLFEVDAEAATRQH